MSDKGDCILCFHPLSDDNDLAYPCCACGVALHKSCFGKRIINSVTDKRKIDQHERAISIINLFKIEKLKKMYTVLISRPIGTHSPVVHYSKGLTTGFVYQRFPVPNFLSTILLANGKYNDLVISECPVCCSDIYIYGRKPYLLRFQKYVDYLKILCIAVPVVLFLSLAGLSMFFGFSLFLIERLSWDNDFFSSNEGYITLMEILRVLMVPHFTYTLISASAGILQLSAASVYSRFYYGIPLSGISKKLQNFVLAKLIFKILYRLTINRYYLESFRRTIPALFGYKLSIEDAWAIQEYRNNHLLEEEEEEDDDEIKVSFWQKCKLWIIDTWYSLTEDFGELYSDTTTSEFLGEYGVYCTFISGLIIGSSPLTKPFLNLFYTDSQNKAFSIFIGLAVTQAVSACVSIYNSINLANSFKKLKPGEGSAGLSTLLHMSKIAHSAFEFYV